MKQKTGPSYLKEYQEKIRPLFDEYFRSEISKAKEAGRLPQELLTSLYRLALRGKNIRGFLVTLGYRAAGGRVGKNILDASLFIEIIHTGFLIHDDIQDRDDMRRGLRTIHKTYESKGRQIGLVAGEAKHYGMSLALNIGASSYFLGMEKLLNSNFPHDRIIRASQLATEYLVRVTHGQVLDIANFSKSNPNKKELLNILRYKSAEYTGVLPLLVGAVLAGKGDKKYLDNLQKYGLAFGWAFQVQDDLLGAFGDEKKLGKSVGIDFKEGKFTMLMYHLFKNGTKEQKAFQAKALGNQNLKPRDVRKMQDILRKSGSYDYVVNLGWDYVKQGESIIPKITQDKKLQETFRQLIRYTMERVQ